MMANADKVAAEANAAAIAEDVGIVQGASADALGIGAGAAETLADVTNDMELSTERRVAESSTASPSPACARSSSWECRALSIWSSIPATS